MAHNVFITNGTGSLEIVNGSYTVTSNTSGYDNSSILPASQDITEGVNSYSFTIGATGTLTLLVTDDGTSSGVPIEGAKFKRCDASGVEYGTEIESNSDGEAVFNNVPFSSSSAPIIYFKQTESDGEHTFDDTLKSTTMTESTGTFDIENPAAPERTFTLTDANYANLPIEDGEIVLSSTT